MTRWQTATSFLGAALVLGLLSPVNAREFTGTVKSADADAQTLTFEDGQTVRVGPGDAAIGYEGETIQGEMDPLTDPPLLYAIWPHNYVEKQVEKSVNQKLHDDTVTLGRKAFRSVGDYIPDFALHNQDGELLRKSSLQGKNFVLNFIFTRCQMPAMCPASTARMYELQKKIDDSDLEEAHLVTITFDPEYDTPGILREYATQRGFHFDNYDLLTGDPEAIENLMKQYGILTIEEDDTINHTMATILVDKHGKVVYRKEGSIWSPDDFFERLQKREAGS